MAQKAARLTVLVDNDRGFLAWALGPHSQQRPHESGNASRGVDGGGGAMTAGATGAAAGASGAAATESSTGAEMTGWLGHFVDPPFRKYAGAANAGSCTLNSRDPAMSIEPTIATPSWPKASSRFLGSSTFPLTRR